MTVALHMNGTTGAMAWYKITMKRDIEEESELIEAFLDVLQRLPSGSGGSALWVQDKDVLAGEAWYFLEAADPKPFQDFIDEYDAQEHAPVDRALLSPAAGTAKNER